MCQRSKGIEILFNLRRLEKWIRDSKLQDSGALQTLEPIKQAGQLLQARKREGDVKSICDMCSKLTIAQVNSLKNILNTDWMYPEWHTKRTWTKKKFFFFLDKKYFIFIHTSLCV